MRQDGECQSCDCLANTSAAFFLDCRAIMGGPLKCRSTIDETDQRRGRRQQPRASTRHYAAADTRRGGCDESLKSADSCEAQNQCTPLAQRLSNGYVRCLSGTFKEEHRSRVLQDLHRWKANSRKVRGATTADAGAVESEVGKDREGVRGVAHCTRFLLCPGVGQSRPDFAAPRRWSLSKQLCAVPSAQGDPPSRL